jgi:4-alpha-glucanotransferase
MAADAWGIELDYEDAFHKRRQPPQTTLTAIRRAIHADRGRPAARARVVRPSETAWDQPGELQLEDGSTISIRQNFPPNLPLGYHRFHPVGSNETIRLIVSPGECPLPADRKSWGWAIQLYATRSRHSWGIGDLADLRQLAGWSKRLGASLLMINPLHAAAPGIPQEPSPYFPTSRGFRNPLYLRIEEIAGASEVGVGLDELAAAGRALNAQRRIDRDQVYRLKSAALERIFDMWQGDERFEAYVEQAGEPLAKFAAFCVLAEMHGRDYRTWPADLRHPASAAVAAIEAQRADRVRFHAWLQWLLDQQLGVAAGELPIMQDLAVGFDPGGADAWMWQDLLAREMSVGAPPDLHNPWGQNWGLPPFVPQKLAEAGFEPFIQTIRSALAHAGGLRIDHAMGMFRLFWIPHGASAADGTYVNYPAKAMLDIVALESHRAGAFVVAEDLGTVEEEMREEFMRHHMLSYRLLSLEKQRPATYPKRSVAAVTTHDLFTIAGLWSSSDQRHQELIGLKPDQEANEKVVKRVRKMTGLAKDAPLLEVSETVHRLLAEAKSMVVLATLEDALLVEERPNMPGTMNEWPNWRIALPTTLEEIERSELPRRIAGILDGR